MRGKNFQKILSVLVSCSMVMSLWVQNTEGIGEEFKTEAYRNHYGLSQIRDYLSTEGNEGYEKYFSYDEKAITQKTEIETRNRHYTSDRKGDSESSYYWQNYDANHSSEYETNDKYYLPSGNSGKKVISWGREDIADDGVYAKVKQMDAGHLIPSGFFAYNKDANYSWLRSACGSISSDAMCASRGSSVISNTVDFSCACAVAFKASLSSEIGDNESNNLSESEYSDYESEETEPEVNRSILFASTASAANLKQKDAKHAGGSVYENIDLSVGTNSSEEDSEYDDGEEEGTEQEENRKVLQGKASIEKKEENPSNNADLDGCGMFLKKISSQSFMVKSVSYLKIENKNIMRIIYTGDEYQEGNYVVACAESANTVYCAAKIIDSDGNGEDEKTIDIDIEGWDFNEGDVARLQVWMEDFPEDGSFASATMPYVFSSFKDNDAVVIDPSQPGVDYTSSVNAFAMKRDLQCSWGKVVDPDNGTYENATFQKIYFGQATDGTPLQFWIAGREDEKGNIDPNGNTICFYQAVANETRKFYNPCGSKHNEGNGRVSIILADKQSGAVYPSNKITINGADSEEEVVVHWRHKKWGQSKWTSGMPTEVGTWELQAYLEATNEHEATYSVPVTFFVFTSMTLGQEYEIDLSEILFGTSNKQFNLSTSDPNIVKFVYGESLVDSIQTNSSIVKLKAVGAGTVTITATQVDDPNVTWSFTISVIYLPFTGTLSSVAPACVTNNDSAYYVKADCTLRINAPDGYTIASTLGGTYGSFVDLDSWDNATSRVYLKNSEGLMTDGVQLDKDVRYIVFSIEMEGSTHFVVGSTYSVVANLEANVNANKKLNWTIDDPSKAKFIVGDTEVDSISNTDDTTVSVKALAPGNVTITATAADGYGATKTLDVMVIDFLSRDVIPPVSDVYRADDGVIWFAPEDTPVIAAPDGFAVAKTPIGPFENSVSINTEDESEIVTGLYFKQTSTGDVFYKSETLRLDSTHPTGNISISERNGWKTFLNAISFGLFFKEEKSATITASDSESGVTSIEYLLANGEMSLSELESSDAWQNYENPITLSKDNKYVVYAKITDNVGNTTYLSSDGIVIYSDSEANASSLSYTKGTKENKVIAVNLKGNTVNEVKLGDTKLTLETQYIVGASGITLLGTYLDTLSAGVHTITISYNPLGIEYVGNSEAPNISIVTLNVANAEISSDNESREEEEEETSTEEEFQNSKEEISDDDKPQESEAETSADNASQEKKEETFAEDKSQDSKAEENENNVELPESKNVDETTTEPNSFNDVMDTSSEDSESEDVDEDNNVMSTSSRSSQTSSSQTNSTVANDKSNWGTEIERNGIKMYKAQDGTISTEIDKSETIWLEKDVDGKGIRYGVDNSKEVFAKGSQFYVKALQNENEDYNELWSQIEDGVKAEIGGKKYLVRIGVIDPSGRKYTDLETNVKFYVQLSDDWDTENIGSYYIGKEKNEKIETKCVEMETPEGKSNFAELMLSHFSPYVIYEKVPDKLENYSTEESYKEENKTKGNNHFLIIVISVIGTITLLSAVYLIFKSKKSQTKS